MSFKYCFLFVISFLVSSLLPAQDTSLSFRKEFSLITENDNYNFTLHDRYYTNGFFLRLNWLKKSETGNNVLKTIHRTEAGQMLYNSYYNRRSQARVLETMDRPYAGWLYGSYGQTKIFSNQDVLQYDGIVGILGPAAMGKQVQTWYHKVIHLYAIYGWEYQLQNEAGINASVKYYHSLVKKNAGNHLSLHAVGKAMLGNTFTNASAGLLLKFGRTEQEENSSYWSAQMGERMKQAKHKTELYAFLEPSVMAQAYNATVQGGMFRTYKGYYVSALNPFLYLIKGGAVLSGQKAAFTITYTVKQREAKSMIDEVEVYGAFGVSFRFH